MALALALFWWLQQRSGQWQVGTILGVLTVVLLGIAALLRRHLVADAGLGSALGAIPEAWQATSSAARWMALLAGLLLILWAALTGMETVLRPVFPWDAWETWGYVAKTASAYPEAVSERLRRPFFDQSMVPLLQVWQAQVLGEWHGAWVNLPWWLGGCTLLLALYGQLRYAGTSFAGSLLAVLVLAFTPLFTVNMALGGYPELWTCAFYALAVMAACLTVIERSWQQAVLLLAGSILLIFTDHYAAGFSVLLWLAVLGVLLPWRWSLSVLAVVFLVTGFWVLTAGIDVNLPKLGRLVISADQVMLPKARTMQFAFTEAPWGEAAIRLFLDATWGLLWIPVVVVTLYSICQWHDQGLRLLLLVAVPTFLLVMAMLLFSRLQLTVVEGTGINRWLFPLLPVMVFWVGLGFARARRVT